MPLIELEGRDAEELKERISRELGRSREELEFEVVEERGILGPLSPKRVKVRAWLKGERVAEFALKAAERIAKAIVPEARAEVRIEEDGLRVEVTGDGSGLLIGRHGKTLEAFRYLLSKMVAKYARRRVSLFLDVEGYKRRRTERVREIALRMARRAKTSGRRVLLPPMSAEDRRVVHLLLRDDEAVETRSVGEGSRRRVSIIPKDVSRETPLSPEG